jgi:hypothetical protein
LAQSGGGSSRFWDCDAVYLYVTGIFSVVMSLVPFFRGSPRIPYMLPLWAVLYAFYRYRLLPEKYKFLLNGLFLAGCYMGLGSLASTFTGNYHGTDVLSLEEGVFGVLPSRWLQQRLVPVDGCPNWFDYPLAVMHSLFFSFPFVTPWLIYRYRGIQPMKRAILAFAVITTAGYATYILWPLTPPWLLAADGVIEPLHRCVFTALTKVVPGFLVSGASNTPRAAMPSLHAGVTLLMVLLLFRELGARRAWWSVPVLAAILFEIVYGAEHFITDIAAGFLFALVAYAFAMSPRFGR